MTALFIGAGRITSALIAGLRVSGYSETLIVYDHHPSNLRNLKRNLRVETEPDLARAITQANLLIVAVRPNRIAELLHDQLRPLFVGTQLAASHVRRKGPLAVSLAAGIPLKRLRAELGRPIRWARAMPSPVCRTANGLTGLTYTADLSPADRRHIHGFFSRVGEVLVLPEKQFDAFSVTYSSSHGYHALAALADSATRMGLSRSAAYAAAAHALADGIDYWRKSKTPLADLLNEAATPGGVAATTMNAMDEAGFRRAVEEGLRAGLARMQRYSKPR